MKHLRSGGKLWAVALALFSLCLQILLPVGLGMAASRPVDDGFSNRILVCTLYGPKIIYDATDKEVPPEDGGNVQCPVCVAYAIGMASLGNAAQIVLPLPQYDAQKTFWGASVALLKGEVASSYLSRAPPLSA